MNHARPGLTLMELVVALAVTGMAVSVGYAAIGGMVDRREALLQEARVLSEASVTRSAIIEWLDAARLDLVRVGPSFRGLDLARDGAPDDVLTFLTGAPTPLGTARTSITLRIGRDSAGKALGLMAEFRDWDGRGAHTINLSADIETLELRFLSGIPGDNDWLTSWISASVLPAAVELRLGQGAGDSLPPLLKAPIIVPMGVR
jgi:prepilin-type N-terminal cleavage/methylation domain-containing protein